MRVLKIILGIVLALIALFLIIAIFTPKEYTASSKITINKPRQVILEYMKVLKNQEQYSEWVKADPNTLPTIEGIDGTVGAVQKWKSEKTGEGSQTITNISVDRIDVDLNFIKPFQSQAKATTILNPVSDSVTEVVSEFYAKDKYPMNVMAYYMGKKMIEETEMKNLQNVKQILEAQ